MEEFITKILAAGGGVSGVYFAFYLWKVVPELRAIWRALDRATKARLLGLIASPHVAPEVKDEATNIIKDTEAEEERAKKRAIIPP
jgi:NADH dehydrogenase FAD-containing subunit